MKKIGFNRPRNGMRKAVDLLYQTFNYQVPSNEDFSNYGKQELVSDLSLMRYDSDTQFKTLKMMMSQKSSSQKVIFPSSDEEKIGQNQQNQFVNNNLFESDQQLTSPGNNDLKLTKKITFFNPQSTTPKANQTIVESQFGKTVKKLSNLMSNMHHSQGSIVQNDQHVQPNHLLQRNNTVQFATEKDQQIGLREKAASIGDNKKYINTPGITSSQSQQMTPKSGYINQQGTKSNFYNKGQLISSNTIQNVTSVQQIIEGSTQNPQISQVQEVLKNIQNEEQSNPFGKKKKHKKRIFQFSKQKERTKNNISSKVSLDAGVSATSIRDPEDESSNQITLGLISQKEGKQEQRNQIKQQDLLENFRLQRSFSDEDQQSQEKSGQNIQNSGQNIGDNIDAVQSSIRNNWVLSKKTTMVDLFDKQNQKKPMSNQYLQQFNRLGMEEWGTSKFQIGEFNWNNKITKLKDSIKKKMPAYSTNLLKQWDQFDLAPTNYSSKRNITQHNYYSSPKDKYKQSFNFYSPSSDLINPSKSFITSYSIYNKPFQNSNNKTLENILKSKKSAQTSTQQTMKNSFINDVNPVSQSEIKLNNFPSKSGAKKDSQKSSQQNIINQTQSKQINYQQEFQNTQNKIIQRKADLQLMEKKIKDYYDPQREKPIIPKGLIDMAKKQSQSSFFKLQDLEKEKKTFNYFEKTPQYQTQEEVDDLQTLKKLKQRSNTYKIFRNHVRQYLSISKE